MKITFEIYYHTRWGESVHLTGSINALGNGDESKTVVMDYLGEGKWSYTIDIPATTKPFTYSYCVKYEGGERKEWGTPRRFVPSKGIKAYRLVDHWRDLPADQPFYASAFTQGIFLRQHSQPCETPFTAGTVTFKVFAPQVRPNEQLLMVGGSPALGDWDVSKAPQLSDVNFPEWEITLDASQLQFPFEYKFVVVRYYEREVVAWEPGYNRYAPVEDRPEKGGATVVSGLVLNTPDLHWRGAGTAIPVFSLRTNYGFGTGEFIDLKYMVDWAVRTGQSFIQLLPVNDTTMTGTWRDSYPYNANSTFALHPQFLRLSEVGELSNPAEQERYNQLRQELNALPDVDYERVNRAKMEYLRLLFEEVGEECLASDDFKAFFQKNEFWLRPYAAYCSLRDRFHTANFNDWPEHAVYNEAAIADYCAVWSPWYKSVALHYFIQYHLHRQLSEVKEYAHRAGVVLKGDIPIGISRDSVDAWVNPHLFHMNGQAGAPPDDFSIEGQNWGFPTYNWEVMAQDGYAWWRARLGKMAEYFDAYRIDHILGFFRIWQIPLESVHGLLGFFNPALPYSPDEISRYGFTFDPAWQAKPYIRDWFLGELFGEYVNEVKAQYLVHAGDDRWRLSDEVDTQRKVVNRFGEANEEREITIREGLMRLLDEVLFIEDPEKRGHYHPRISAQFTYAYRSLDDHQKHCYNRLYDDFFYVRHNDFWKEEAMRKLPALIHSTDMLVCGEDLGMIPLCVPEVMEQLQILSLEIQRMPKEYGVEFGNTWAYPYRSVCTTSTHDMSGIRAWWEEDRERTQHFYNNVLGEEGEAPIFCEPWICERIVMQHLQAPSMLTILPLQDWLSIDGRLRRDNPQVERINIPANSRHYWRYRMHLTIEQLLDEGVFNTHLKAMIENSGRGTM